MTNKDKSWWRVYALILLQRFRQLTLKQEETTQYTENSLTISGDNMKNPSLPRIFHHTFKETSIKR
jgi:hypothetical protein